MTSDDESYILVVCPTCRARLHPRRELGGKRVRCPDCGVAVRVPTAAQVAKARRRMPTSVGEYRVADEGVTEIDQPDCFLLLCPTCGARLHPHIELVGKRVRCPDCERPVLVTAPREPVKVKERQQPGEYGVGETPIERPPVNVELLRSTGTIEPIPLPAPPPRLWFYEGVLSFPWKRESIGRWLILSLIALVTDAITTYAILSLPIFERGFNFDQGSAITSMLVVWLGSTLWAFTLFYAANCVFSVIRDTAFGNDVVTDWGDADLSEGIWRLFFLVVPLLAAGSLGYAAMFLTAMVWPAGALIVGLATAALVYPIMLLSIVDGNAVLRLFTATVLRGVATCWRAWLLFYFESALLVAAWTALAVLGTTRLPILTVLVTAPLAAALVLILARLLGRLAWHVACVLEERAEASNEEEEAGVSQVAH